MFSDSVLDRFWEKVEEGEPDQCWEWTAGKITSGYGSFWLHGRQVLAHRVAWELVNGPIPGGLLVCHHCDNPGCVNPSHLFLGSDWDNAADRDAKGRGNMGTGEASLNPKLTDAKVLEIRQKYAIGKYTLLELGRLYGCSEANISYIVRGLTWSHI